MASTDFKIISDFLEGKSRQLWEHEQRMGFNRTFAKLRLDESHFSKIEISGRRFFIVSTRVFREILSGVLSQACEAYPHQFGSGRAEDVISALYKVESIGTPTGFQDFLNEEQFAWIIEIISGGVNPKVLRVELFG